jgi:hypothetical protein
MPFHWTIVPSSPARKRKDDVAAICRRHGGRLVGEQIFFDDMEGRAHALIGAPDNATLRAILDDLGATEWLGLVDADEKEQGKRPPPSGRRP